MKKFIAYFDYLGFKEFILNNNLETQQKILGNNFRDIERALGNGKYHDSPSGLIADISESKLDCINFSDTVVFSTKDNSKSSIVELIKVAHKFNWQSTLFTFPARGSLVYGEIEHISFDQTNGGGGTYTINSFFGRGLIDAYLLAEEQDWSGAVLDESFINGIVENGFNPQEILSPYSKKYKVPYKNALSKPEEYVLNIITGILNKEAQTNFENTIRTNFSQYNKTISHSSVQRKIENTIAFLNSFLP